MHAYVCTQAGGTRRVHLTLPAALDMLLHAFMKNSTLNWTAKDFSW